MPIDAQYCEFGGTARKCKDWLEAEHKDMYERLYSEGLIYSFSAHTSKLSGIYNKTLTQPFFVHGTAAITASLSTLSVDAQKRAQKDTLKKEARALALEAKESEAKKAARVLIRRVERNKRKYVTAVSGLEAHGMDLKKVAKEWGKKFATGSSVTKTPSGGEEVVVQGDNSDEILDWVINVGGVPEGNVECVEDKKKKGGG